MTTSQAVPGLPFELTPSTAESWRNGPERAAVTAVATGHTDIFIDPATDSMLNAETMLNAATLLGVPPEGDFQFSARVSVDFAATSDAGVLLLWVDERHWGSCVSSSRPPASR